MKCLNLVIVLALFLSFVPVKTGNAISKNVVIAQVQTGGVTVGSASQDFVLLHNAAGTDVDITDWCLEYSPKNDGLDFSKLACVESPDAQTELWVGSEGYISFATEEFILENPEFVSDFVSALGIAYDGHIRLVDAEKNEIDRVGWGNAVNAEGGVPAAKHLENEVLGRNYDINGKIVDTDNNKDDFMSKPLMSPVPVGFLEEKIDVCQNIDGQQVVMPVGFLTDESGDCKPDVCLNINGLQTELADGYYLPGREWQVPDDGA